MKTLIKFSQFSLLVLLVAGCSSAPKKTAPVEDDHAGKVELETMPPVPSKTSNADAVATPVNSKSANSSALSEAIRSGSDESIYRVASSMLMQNANDVKALNAMGLFHNRKGRPLAARLFFSKALSIQPDNSELHSNMGLTYLANQEQTAAIRAFRKAIELNPADISATTNLGSIYMENRDFSKAFSVLSLNTGRSKDIKFLNNFAIACAWKGKVEQAESLYQEALKLSPNNREILFNYAVFQIDYQAKFKEGLETLDHLKLIGLVESMKNTTKDLEIRAKAGLK